MDSDKKGIVFNRILIAISGILLIVFGVSIYLAVSRNDFSIINYISITSTFSIALLTVIYVYASTRQMHVMELQLIEMKEEHLLRKQPILLLNQPEFQFEKPRFFYTPPTNQFSFTSRYHFNAMIVNVSDDPAIIIHIVTKIVIPHGDKELILAARTKRLNYCSAMSKPQKISIMFIDDNSGVLYDALREKKRIKINTVIYYQNTASACFSISNTYSYNLATLLIRQSNSEAPESSHLSDTIINWHTSISQAPIKYKEGIKHLESIVRRQDDRSVFDKKFDTIKSDFDATLSYHEDLCCPIFEDSDSFMFKTITKDEFDKGTDDSDFIEMHFPGKEKSAKKLT